MEFQMLQRCGRVVWSNRRIENCVFRKLLSEYQVVRGGLGYAEVEKDLRGRHRQDCCCTIGSQAD